MNSKSNAAEQIAEALGKTLVCATGRNLSPQAAGHLHRACEHIVALSYGASECERSGDVETEMQAEIGRLRLPLDTAIAERDAARAELAAVKAERDIARQWADTQKGDMSSQLATLRMERDGHAFDLEHERVQVKRLVADLRATIAARDVLAVDLKTAIAERDAAQAELVKLSDTVIGVATGASEEEVGSVR